MKAKPGTVEFKTAPYLLAHGRHPRGQGSWAFCPTETYQGLDYLEHVRWYQGTYAEAKRQAAADFAADGVFDVTVCT